VTVQKIERVGLIGLGKMGGPMARHMTKAGFKVTGFDMNKALVDAAAKDGCAAAANAAEVAAASDMVLIAVGFDAEAETAIFAEDGLLAGAKPGLIIAVASTVAPRTMTRIAERAADATVRFIDCPLTRGEQATIDGKMLTMVGGDTELFEACKPVMETYADSIFHLGALGAGQTGKMVNNMILWACMSANREAKLLTEALGVDWEPTREALLASSAQNWVMETRADEHPTPWAEKDMMIALAEADRQRLPLPVAGVVKEAIKLLKIERGYPTPAVTGD
jgi:3-hydroxyisobutyrate dehydrogenase-like beta-hydroxyacid dehydrogenase